jgi:ribonuclease Z
MKRIATIVAGVVVVLIAAAWIAMQFTSVDLWLYRHAATERAGGSDVQLAKPGELSVLLCGTNAPLPDPNRAGGCALIAAGDDLYVVDTGMGSVRNLMTWHVPLEKIKGVFFTHFHSDHIGDLGELRLQTWVAGRRALLKVYGGPGVEDVVDGFNRAYSHDADYRTAHHGEKMLPREDVDLVPVIIPMNGATAQALTENGLKVTAIRVDHGPVKPAYGYRFDYNGRSVTISGDTAPYHPLAVAARGSDVLVHEAQSNVMVGILGEVLAKANRPRPAKIMHDIQNYHTTPVQAAQIANEAQAKLLVFTHINPPLPTSFAEHAFVDGVSGVRRDGWLLGRDGTLIRLPGHSDTIERTSLP